MLRARVGVLVAAVTACLGTACGPSTPGGSSTSSGSYGSYQIDPGHSGYIAGGKLKPPLNQLWTPIATPGGSTFPVVVNGVLYVVIFPSAGSDVGLLYAVDASTGVNLWPPVDVADGLASSVGVGDGYIVVSTEGSYVTVFEASTGTQVWTEALSTLGTGQTTAIIENGVVYVNNADGNVWALEETDGTVLWNSGTAQSSVPTISPLVEGYAYIVGPMAVAGGFVLGNNGTPGVNALEAASGVLSYNFTFEGGIVGWAMSVFDDTAMVSGAPSGGILMNIVEGEETGNGLYYVSSTTPVTDGTQGYLVDRARGVLTSTNLSTNATAWVYFPPGDEALTAEPLLVNGVIYTASAATGTLYAVSTEGKGLWSDSSLGWIDPRDIDGYFFINTLTWGTMGSDGDYLAVATTNSIAVYGSN